MIKRTVTWEQMQEMRGNTSFWLSLFPKMTADAFIKQAQHYLNNCSPRRENTVYDDAVINVVLPEALNRIQELEETVKELENSLYKISSRRDYLVAKPHKATEACDMADEVLNRTGRRNGSKTN